MANKMLIDATHPEETRVVVVRGNRVEECDFESASRRQLRGNIYLAKVTRVEPSLQAAFVEYGGNRHGFLALSEIHPDHYQIPVPDRQAPIHADERPHRQAQEEGQDTSSPPPSRARSSRPRRRGHNDRVQSEIVEHADAEAPEVAALAGQDRPQDGENLEHGDHEHAEHEAATHHDEEGHEPHAYGHDDHGHDDHDHDDHDHHDHD